MRVIYIYISHYIAFVSYPIFSAMFSWFTYPWYPLMGNWAVFQTLRRPFALPSILVGCDIPQYIGWYTPRTNHQPLPVPPARGPGPWALGPLGPLGPLRPLGPLGSLGPLGPLGPLGRCRAAEPSSTKVLGAWAIAGGMDRFIVRIHVLLSYVCIYI